MGAGGAKRQGLKRRVKSLQWEPWVLKQRKVSTEQDRQREGGVGGSSQAEALGHVVRRGQS